ncbi:uncharacterized protein BP5553_02252 [Venustampulla echinocandica]|uniref:C3H1-type domain-containing protein n=1 Tax=Venustampulla echinocandica TaxID=2656787 RepID=A0A370U3G0_9HELO|nr:uncharacterized protein BP5553_02252 [Venustampulla echinocandica]RDL42273.1 hypothetical protein BP5553_02252 [Venustampulla echinocandica]
MSPKTQPRKPWPSYFIVRTTGEVVPLIAVDELPQDVNIAGVPRELDLKEAIGMLNLGLQKSCGASYKITHEKAKVQGQSNGLAAEPTTQSSANIAGLSTSTRLRTSPNIKAPLVVPSSTPSTTMQQKPRRQICRYWCANGICKWGLQCRHHHMMPMDLPGLQEIGLNDWPIWYRRSNSSHFVTDLGRTKASKTSQSEGRIRTKNAKGSASVSRGVESVEQALRKFRELDVSGKGKGSALAGAKSKSGGRYGSKNTVDDRLATRDATDWGDDEITVHGDEGSDISSASDGEAIKVFGKGKLVDV